MSTLFVILPTVALVLLILALVSFLTKDSKNARHQAILEQIRDLQRENETLKGRLTALEVLSGSMLSGKLHNVEHSHASHVTTQLQEAPSVDVAYNHAEAEQKHPIGAVEDQHEKIAAPRSVSVPTIHLAQAVEQPAMIGYDNADKDGVPTTFDANRSQRQPATGSLDLESIIGGRWAVWFGGIILAIGGLFLVRYTYEAGILGPKVRLTAAFVLSVALGVAAEVLRRKEGTYLPSIPPAQAAHIPSIAMSAAVTILFGTVYAAHAVYAYIGPPLAFILMGLAGLGALALAMIMGRLLIVIGLLGSYLTPLLVGGSAENLYPLAVFLTLVTAFALLIYSRLATTVQDDWIAWCIAGGMISWSWLLSLPTVHDHASLVLITAGCGLWAATMTLGRTGTIERRVDQALVLWLPGFLLAVILGVRFSIPGTNPIPIALAGLIVITIALAQASLDWRTTWMVQTSTLLPVGIILMWRHRSRAFSFNESSFELAEILNNPMSLSQHPEALIFGVLALSMALAAPFLLQWSNYAIAIPKHPRWQRPWAETSTHAFVTARSPVMIASAIALSLVGLHHSWWAGAGFALLAVILGVGAEMLFRRTPESWPDPRQRESFYLSSSAYAAAASLAIGISVAYTLPAMWMAVGFAIACMMVAIINTYRPLHTLRYYASFFAVMAVIRTLFLLPLDDMGSWPVLNGLLIAYGVPALAFSSASWFLRRDKKDIHCRIVEITALAFAAALLLFSVRHAFNGSVTLLPLLFHECWVLGVVAVAYFMIAWQLFLRTEGAHFRTAAQISLVVFINLLIVGFGLSFNPLVTGELGPETIMFNRLSVSALIMSAAALLPAIMLWRGKGAFLAKGFALCSTFSLVLLTVQQTRIGFHGADMLDRGQIGLGEAGLYTLMTLAVAGAATLVQRRFNFQTADIAAFANLLAYALIIILGGKLANPVTQNGLVGWPVLDSSLVGYLAPALCFLWLSYRFQPAADWHPKPWINQTFSVFFIYVFVVLQVRRAFAGASLIGPISELEQYAYSLTTLVFGVLLLAWGMLDQQRVIRLASGVVVVAAICKAFLFDMSSLQGVLRALSFIGLGLALIGIGMCYQRFLLKRG